MQRYFLEEPYQKKATYTLEGEAYHHLVRVMRMTTGQQVYVVFADQVAILAEISGITETQVTVVELEKEQQEKELPVSITIASGYPKGDKLDYIVQKATELGMAHFIGFPAKTSVVKWDDKKLAKKQQRLTKIAQEAAEQSQRQLTPTVTLLTNQTELVASFSAYDQVLVAYEEAAKSGETAQLVQTFESLAPGSRLLVLFGPEGGITPEEQMTFEQAAAKRCGLGPRILRTETAPLYVLSAASYVFELKR